jgi:hypothetical protein
MASVLVVHRTLHETAKSESLSNKVSEKMFGNASIAIRITKIQQLFPIPRCLKVKSCGFLLFICRINKLLKLQFHFCFELYGHREDGDEESKQIPFISRSRKT